MNKNKLNTTYNQDPVCKFQKNQNTYTHTEKHNILILKKKSIETLLLFKNSPSNLQTVIPSLVYIYIISYGMETYIHLTYPFIIQTITYVNETYL